MGNKNKKIFLLTAVLMLTVVSAFALLKTGVFGKEKNFLATDNNARYDIVADLDGGSFEVGAKPEFVKMSNGKWLHKYKPTAMPTKIDKPVKPGYKFIGWSVESDSTDKPEYSIPAWNKKNINLTAHWKSEVSMLLPGREFNAKLSSMSGFSNVREIRFEKGVPEANGVNVAESGEAIAHIDGDILIIKCTKEIYANPDCSNMFKGFGYRPNTVLNTIMFNNFNTSKVTTMLGMFRNCAKLQSLDLSNFDTTQVETMSLMFFGCYTLNRINLSSFNTAQVNSMSSMFSSCHALSSLDLLKFNTSKVTDMSSMFSDCDSLTNLDLSSFNTSLVTTMNNMFEDCSALRTLKIDNFDTSKVEYTEYMFYGCQKLSASLKIMNPNIIHYRAMFIGCSTDLDAEFWLHYTSGHTRYRAKRMIGNPLGSRHIYIKELESQLLSGEEFNAKLNEVPDIESVDEIIFLKDEPNLDGVDLSKDQNGLVRGRMYGSNTLAIKCATEIFANEDCTGMFKGYSGINKIAMENLNTSRVISMQDMFSGCSSLYSLDFGTFNTSKVINMGNMFKDCSRISYLNINDWIASSVTDMSGMFSGCQRLSTLKLPKEMDNVVNMSSMFNNCTELSGELTVTNINITRIDNMFTGCSSDPNAEFWVKYIDTETKALARRMVSTKTFRDHVYLWETETTLLDGPRFNSKVKALPGFKNVTKINFVKSLADPEGIDLSEEQDGSISGVINGDVLAISSNLDIYANRDSREMFQTMRKISSITFDNFNTSKVIDMGSMFESCSDLLAIDVSSFDTSKVTNMYRMFYCCERLTTLDVSNFNTSSVINMGEMFNQCLEVTALDVSNFNTSKVTVMNKMFDGCSRITSLNLSSFNTSNVTDISNMFSECLSITSLDINNFNTSKVTNMHGVFSGCSKLESIDLSKFNTSKVTDMHSMFIGCLKLKSINLSSFDTSKVTDMSHMFERCSDMTTLNISKFNTSNVTNINNMFGGCSRLTALNLSNFDTSKVTDFTSVFRDCGNLTRLNLGEFNTSCATDMGYLFSNCAKLTELDVSGFDTSKVTDMSNLFNNCSSLTKLDVSGFDTSKVTDMRYMFFNCANLTSLDISRFDTSKVTDMRYMFFNCSRIKATFTIMNPNVKYDNIFPGCCVYSRSFILNYTDGCASVAKSAVNTHNGGNVRLGRLVQRSIIRIKSSSNVSDEELKHQLNSDLNMRPKLMYKPQQVTITLNNGSMAMYPVQKIQIPSGKIGDLAKPDLNPKYAGQFGGYFYDKNCTIPVKSDDVVTQDIELYAKW